jgi:hypothetical protein
MGAAGVKIFCAVRSRFICAQFNITAGTIAAALGQNIQPLLTPLNPLKTHTTYHF